MIVGNRTFTGGTHVMAILNLTPDSFWQASRVAGNVLSAAEKAVNEGAEILDLGPQSTRPGYTEISAEEEISRFEIPLRQIKKHFDIPVSVDTYFSLSARAALENGADMVNDVWGLSRDNDMAKIIAKYNSSVCIMHNAKTSLSGDIWQPITDFLNKGVKKAVSCGIDKNKICLDGGIGFAKDRRQNLELMNGYERLAALGYPLLIGTSRKSLFGGDVKDRLQPTLQSTRLAVKKGIMFVRVHDVKENVQAIKEAEYEYSQH